MNEPKFDENAVFLRSELDAYREHVISTRLYDRKYLEELGDDDFIEFDQKTDGFRTMGDDALFDHMINNFWARLPGGFYREVFEKNKNERGLDYIDRLNGIVEKEGLKEVAERIVRKDPQLDPEEKRAALKKMYCAMRMLGYSCKELTS